MIPHERDKMNPYNKTSVDSKVDNFNKEFVEDGLNNLRTNVVSVQKFPLFVKLLVDVGHRILSTQPSDQLRPTVSITWDSNSCLRYNDYKLIVCYTLDPKQFFKGQP